MISLGMSFAGGKASFDYTSWEGTRQLTATLLKVGWRHLCMLFANHRMGILDCHAVMGQACA